MLHFAPSLSLVFIFFFECAAICGQTFQSVGTDLGISLTHEGLTGGNGLSSADFNMDGWDDLSFALPGEDPVFYVNNQGSFELVDLGIPNVDEGDIKIVLWADYDNDGDQDLFYTCEGDQVRLFNNNGEMGFTDVTQACGILEESVSHYGASFGDYNNDGWLDLFVCKYEGLGDASIYENKNHLYANNQDGTFTDVSLESGIANVQNLSFQAAFFDYNEDGWQDIYIINDKFAHPNEMYLNNGDGTFNNTSFGTNTSLQIDAMSVAIADFDNDEHQDIYITNTLAGNVLLRNNGFNSFADLAAQAGVAMNIISWGASWIDYDNDGWQDLYVATATNFMPDLDQNQFFRNNGNLTFQEVHEAIGLANDEKTTYGVVAGDFNNDGYPDFAQNNISPYPCDIYQNTGGENNWLKVSVEGTASNSDGIGSWIKLYAGGLVQSRYMHCGDGYLQQDSFRKMFGIGENDVIDSLTVDWLSGHTDVLYNIPINTIIHIIEGQTLGGFAISYQGDLEICEGESLLLNAGLYQSYEWSNGWTEQFLEATEAGDYWVNVTNQLGIALFSDTLTLAVFDAPNITVLEVNDVTCAGGEDGTIQIFNTSGTGTFEVYWDGIETGIPLLPNANAGIHTYTFIDLNNCSSTGEVEVTEPPAVIFDVETSMVSCFGYEDGSATVTYSGGSGPLTLDLLGLDLDALNAGTHNVLVTDSLGCETVISIEIGQPEEIVLEISIEFDPKFGGGTIFLNISGGTPEYDIEWSTGEEDVTEIIGVPEGDYSVTVTDANGCIQTTDFIVVGIGEIFNIPFLLWPNPVVDFVQVRSPEYPLSMKFYDLSGHFIHAVSLSENKMVDLSWLDSGVYVIDISWKNYSCSTTIIKD